MLQTHETHSSEIFDKIPRAPRRIIWCRKSDYLYSGLLASLATSVIYFACYTMSRREVRQCRASPDKRCYEETEMNYASSARESLYSPSTSRRAPVHLFLRDLYYGNSARTTSRLTFDNNAAASEKAACRGGGAVAAGVATRPGESLSQVRHTGEPGTLPASSAHAALQDVWPPPARVPDYRRNSSKEKEREKDISLTLVPSKTCVVTWKQLLTTKELRNLFIFEMFLQKLNKYVYMHICICARS